MKSAKALFFLTLIVPLALYGQGNAPVLDAEGNSTYLFPINPGVVNTLAGTMGELRNTHFHSGLDIRTNNSIGMAVQAAQSGYVSRVIKSTYSYGNVIFIAHPDNNTTLYAHLNAFNGKLADYVRRQQYKEKTFEIDIKLKPGEFPVNRGDTIAWSGNTGSSNGPHLHFDIRDKNMDALNPLNFGFDEIEDKTKPIVQKVAFRTLDINSRINGRFGRFEFSAFKVGSDYILAKPILATGKIGVEILAYDRMDNSRFQCGINTIIMKADSQQVFKQVIDKINMSVTRGIVSLFDYSAFRQGGHRYNKLFIDDGNPQNFYEGTVNRGVINVSGKDVDIQIELTDSYSNTTNVKFTLKNDPAVKKLLIHPAINRLLYSIDENILTVNSKACQDTTATWFVSGKTLTMDETYSSPYAKVFLYDLRKGVPDSIQVCKESLKLDIKDKIPSKTEYTYYNEYSTIYFPDSALFDTLYFSVKKQIEPAREVITIGDNLIPLMKDIKVEWLPEGTYDSAYSVYKINGRGDYLNLGRMWKNGKVTFETREFGDFTLLKDSIAPGIRMISCNQSYARFKITDDLSGIYSFTATINGEWLLMNYDYKSGILYSEKLDKKVPFKGDFELKVRDYSGNEKVYKQKI